MPLCDAFLFSVRRVAFVVLFSLFGMCCFNLCALWIWSCLAEELIRSADCALLVSGGRSLPNFATLFLP